jgi:hypothetical protein
MRGGHLSVRTRPGASWLPFIASIAAAAAGVSVMTVLAPREAVVPARSPGVLRAEIASLRFSTGWESLGRAAIPGLEGAPSARADYLDIALDVRMPDDPSLLPDPMLDALGRGGLRPVPTNLGGRRVWSYEFSGPAQTRIAALAMPTTRGVVTLACRGPEDLAVAVTIDCEEALSTVELTAAAPLVPARETAARLVATPVIAQLDEVRSAARRTLASTRSPRRRATAAKSIAAAYAAAARRLEPLARGTVVALPRLLAVLARDHDLLSVASARRDARSALRAGRAIERHERRLASRLATAPR